MIKEFCLAWDNNKKNLEDYFRTHTMGDYSEYCILVKLLFDLVINPSIHDRFITRNKTFDACRFVTEKDEIREIDDGEYRGTLIYILHKNTYKPGVSDYIYTSVSYGSCRVCDTLQAIHEYEYDNFPDKEQIKDYMSLCLHLLENCHYLDGSVG